MGEVAGVGVALGSGVRLGVTVGGITVGLGRAVQVTVGAGVRVGDGEPRPSTAWQPVNANNNITSKEMRVRFFIGCPIEINRVKSHRAAQLALPGGKSCY